LPFVTLRPCPPTYSKKNVVGSVVSVMYDIPFAKVLKILMRKEQ